MGISKEERERRARLEREDEEKAALRFVDQPGQWVDTTPPEVKKRQQKAWEELFREMNKQNKPQTADNEEMSEEPKMHSGFEAPVFGTLIPKGTKWKRNPDGTRTPIYPEKEEENP